VATLESIVNFIFLWLNKIFDNNEVLFDMSNRSQRPASCIRRFVNDSGKKLPNT
jgi:hypothetical protein